MNDEIQAQLNKIEKRLGVIEQKTHGIQPTALLNQQSVDPASSKFLQDFIAVPYISTGTAFITTTPNKDGYLKLTKSASSGKFYLYAYVAGGWKSVEIT